MKTREEQILDMWKAERDTLCDWLKSIDFKTPYDVKTVVVSRISELNNWISKKENK